MKSLGGAWACLALLWWASTGATAQVAVPAAYASVTYEAWSNGVPILQLDGDWGKGYQRRDGTQRAYVSARAEVGGQWVWAGAPWRLGLLGRADANARVSGQAAEVIYRYQNRTDPPQPVTLNADTRLQYWSGQGLSLHTPAWRWGMLDMAMSWDHMTLRRMRSLQTQGQVSFNADESYAYRGTLRDDNSRAAPRFMPPAQACGEGDALSLSLAWRGAQADALALMPDHVLLQLQDAWSLLRWHGMNGNDAVLDSNVSQHTPEGYIEYRAAMIGQYTRRTIIERIPMGTQIDMAWDVRGGQWSVRAKQRLGLWQRWLAWQSQDSVKWHIGLEPWAGALSLGVTWSGLSASVMTNRLDRAAHARGVQLDWMLPL